jgi:hypothetical protein
MENDVHESRQRESRRDVNSGYWDWVQNFFPDDTDTARAFGDEYVATWKKRECPWMQ